MNREALLTLKASVTETLKSLPTKYFQLKIALQTQLTLIEILLQV